MAMKETNFGVVSKGRILSYEEALKHIGFGRVQFEALFAMGLALMDVITESMGIGNLIPAAQCDLQLTGTTKGLLTSTVFFGVVCSSYMFGYLGDTQGRRFIIMWSLLFAKLFTLIAVFMKNVYIFMACRFITGVFVGGYSAILFAYLGEFNTTNNRPTILTWVGTFVATAYIVIPIIALWLNKYTWRYELYPGYEFRPWRLCMILYSIPGIISGLWCIRLPESPKYLLTVNKDHEALKATEWIHKTNKCKKPFDISKLKSDEQGTGNSIKGLRQILTSLRNQTVPLLKPPYLASFVACCALQFGTFFISTGLGLFLPDILNKLSQYRDENCNDESECSFNVCATAGYEFQKDLNSSLISVDCDDSVDSNVYEKMILLGSVYIFMYVTIAAFMKPNRRKYIIALTYGISSLFGFALPFINKYILITACFIMTIVSAGMNITLVSGAACDIFPTYLRSMAVCTSMLVGRFGTTVASNLLGNLLDDYCSFTYLICACVGLICCAMSFVLSK